MPLFSKSKPPINKSVETITARLHDTVAELESHAEDQLVKAQIQQSAIAAAIAAHDGHRAEHALAKKVASNIGALLSG